MADLAPPDQPKRGFWQRRVVDPIVAQLTQGVTPDKIALTIALGVACGMFPFLGFTTLLCFVVALLFRLNQPIIHVVNQLLWPVHLAMILVYIKAGAWLYGAEPLPFDAEEAARLFLESQREFWEEFGLIGLHVFTAWLLSAPVIAAALYYSLRPVLRHLASIAPARA